MISWRTLDSEAILAFIIDESYSKIQIIFKHSTTCPISGMAKRRLENDWTLDVVPYCLDLLAHRGISNAIAEKLDVVHQSPQIIIIKAGKSIYAESHLDIFPHLLKNSIEASY